MDGMSHAIYATTCRMTMQLLFSDYRYPEPVRAQISAHRRCSSLYCLVLRDPFIHRVSVSTRQKGSSSFVSTVGTTPMLWSPSAAISRGRSATGAQTAGITTATARPMRLTRPAKAGSRPHPPHDALASATTTPCARSRSRQPSTVHLTARHSVAMGCVRKAAASVQRAALTTAPQRLVTVFATKSVVRMPPLHPRTARQNAVMASATVLVGRTSTTAAS
jgi:hypothetical protein